MTYKELETRIDELIKILNDDNRFNDEIKNKFKNDIIVHMSFFSINPDSVDLLWGLESIVETAFKKNNINKQLFSGFESNFLKLKEDLANNNNIALLRKEVKKTNKVKAFNPKTEITRLEEAIKNETDMSILQAYILSYTNKEKWNNIDLDDVFRERLLKLSFDDFTALTDLSGNFNVGLLKGQFQSFISNFFKENDYAPSLNEIKLKKLEQQGDNDKKTENLMKILNKVVFDDNKSLTRDDVKKYYPIFLNYIASIKFDKIDKLTLTNISNICRFVRENKFQITGFDYKITNIIDSNPLMQLNGNQLKLEKNDDKKYAIQGLKDGSYYFTENPNIFLNSVTNASNEEVSQEITCKVRLYAIRDKIVEYLIKDPNTKFMQDFSWLEKKKILKAFEERKLNVGVIFNGHQNNYDDKFLNGKNLLAEQIRVASDFEKFMKKYKIDLSEPKSREIIVDEIDDTDTHKPLNDNIIHFVQDLQVRYKFSPAQINELWEINTGHSLGDRYFPVQEKQDEKIVSNTSTVSDRPSVYFNDVIELGSSEKQKNLAGWKNNNLNKYQVIAMMAYLMERRSFKWSGRRTGSGSALLRAIVEKHQSVDGELPNILKNKLQKILDPNNLIFSNLKDDRASYDKLAGLIGKLLKTHSEARTEFLTLSNNAVRVVDATVINKFSMRPK